MHLIAALVALLVSLGGMAGFARAFDYTKPAFPRPRPEPGLPILVYRLADKTDDSKDPDGCGAPGCPNLAAEARPLDELEALFTGMPYPAEALRKRQWGPVAVRLKIGAHGRVAHCAAVERRMVKSLARTTCAILRARARFRPARDRKGLAATGIYYFDRRWRLPD